MRERKIRNCKGMSVMEVTLSLLIGLFLLLVVGNLLVTGHKQWDNLYNYSTKKIRSDAQNIYRVFGKIGRKSNRLSYVLYKSSGSGFYPALPESSTGEEVVYGDAVEFHYWDVELDSNDSHNLLNVNKDATAYAFLYVDDGVLKLDYGSFPPTAVPEGGGSRNTNGVRTYVLADNVSYDEEKGPFFHTVLNGVGSGCVKIDIVLNDQEEEETVAVQTATMMRNTWPR